MLEETTTSTHKKYPGFTWLKIIIITILVLAISFLAIMQWKSDAIMQRVMTMVEKQMADTLYYDDVSLEWFAHFPSAALQLENLHIGSKQSPFIDGGDVAVVLKLFPLLKDKIVVKRLELTNSNVYITQYKSHWSYDVFASVSDDTIKHADLAGQEKKGWSALIKQIDLVNTHIFFDNREGTLVNLKVEEGTLDGNMKGDLLDIDIDLQGVIDSLITSSYQLPIPFRVELTGDYIYASADGRHELKNWEIKNAGITFETSGIIKKQKDGQFYDLTCAWNNGDPSVIKKLIPADKIRQWDQYEIAGNSEGQVTVKGVSGEKSTPRIVFSSELKNGSIKFPGQGGQLKSMVLNIAYNSGEGKNSTDSYLRANLRNGSFQGKNVKANFRMENLEAPVINLDLKGAFPVSLLNLVMDSTMWKFEQGVFDFDEYVINGLASKNLNSKTFLEKSAGKLEAKDVKLKYNKDIIALDGADINLSSSGLMKLDLDELVWNKAAGENIKGTLDFKGEKVFFELEGDHSGGHIVSKGVIDGWGGAPVMRGDWVIREIEIDKLLYSFGNFDQTFITDQNLKGKANVWTETVIPYDKKGNLILQNVSVKAAVEINDGSLKGMKILEDFSKYVHIDDLRDIRFNEFRNYLKIEKGKVYCPVVFLQSSAINMSVNGIHSFDQDISYNLKLNAGQAVATKLKKQDVIRRFKPARKSGWINLYYVLSGTTSDVRYDQDQKAVIMAFEESASMKENLRNYLVDKFGHDVYWIEPNEWEDIPEYQ